MHSSAKGLVKYPRSRSSCPLPECPPCSHASLLPPLLLTRPARTCNFLHARSQFNSAKENVDEEEFRGLVPLLRLPTLKLRDVLPEEKAALADLPTIMRDAAETAQFYALKTISVHMALSLTNWRKRAQKLALLSQPPKSVFV